MEANVTNISMDQQKQTMAMNPIKFALWLFISTVVMVFAALTSAYIVRRGEGNWLVFDMPEAFIYTSIVIILSSVSMQMAHHYAKKDELGKLKLSLVITILLGGIFLVGQYYSWSQLVAQDVYFVGNPAGSFVYVLTGLHAVHLVSAVIFLLVVVSKSFNMKIHSRKMNIMDMCTTYWHFLGGLWLYLYFFLLLNS